MMRVMVGVKIPHRSVSYVWETNPKKFKLFCVLTAVDDACAQCHKTVGAKGIYTALEHQGVRMHEHARDNNAAIAKNVREKQPTAKNQLDNLQALKQLQNALRTISEGLMKSLGIIWHGELINKTCGGDLKTLKSTLQNPIEHHKGNRANCFPESRCKREALY